MTRLHAFVVALGASATLGATSLQSQPLPAPPLSDSVRTRIDAVFDRWDRTDSPGCAVGISRDGREVFTRGYGMADLQHGLAITPGSIFHVASVSKQFAAFAVGLLAEDGRLSLDDDVRRHVPELPELGPITIRQMIHHTSGLRDQWQLLGYAGWRFPDDLITEDDVLRIVSRQKGLNFRPGDEWVYSNTGYTLLAVIVKRVTGQTLREFAHQRIFVPLGMTRTHFHDDHAMIVPGRTSAYEPRAGGGWRISIPVFDTYGATSLFTTASDLLRWMANLDTPTVGSQRLVDALHRSGVLNDGTATQYGHGVALGTYRGVRTVGHGGADAGYRSNVERYPERGVAIAVLCNASPTAPNVLTRRIADIVLGLEGTPDTPAVDTVPRPSTREQKLRWVGTYRDTVTQQVVRIRLVGDSLVLGDGRALVTTSDTTVRTVGSGQGAVLRLENGEVRALVLLPRTTRDQVLKREAPFTPDRAALARFTGAYQSDELDVRYDVVLADSGLVLRHRKWNDRALVPASRDAFTSGFGGLMQFTRDRAGRVNGFTVADGRVRGVRFERVR